VLEILFEHIPSNIFWMKIMRMGLALHPKCLEFKNSLD
jgi:hypothetical protein